MAERGNPAGGGEAMDAETRCGFVAVLGETNAGKSTLVNALVGTKVSIVSRKVQTTRSRVRGILVDGASQVVLVDTPGLFKPRRRLDRAMVDAAWRGARDVDAIILVVDAAKEAHEGLDEVLARLGGLLRHRILVLNKVDRVADKARLLGLAQRLTAAVPFDQVFMLSALDGDGVAALKAHLAGLVPKGPWHFPEDDVSDLPVRQLAAEITREKIYDRLHQEVPYAIAVETTDWKSVKAGAIRIEQTIFVERDSQKKIVIGAKGQTIKSISMDARKEIAEAVGQPVHLFLFVKVRDWTDDPERYKAMGLEFPSE